MSTGGRIKIYTKTGDKGSTALFTGERKPKDDEIFEALGTVDELNASIGVAVEHCKLAKNGLEERLQKIQCILIDIGAHIATPRNSPTTEARLERTAFDHGQEYIKDLEMWIDEYDSQLPPLRNFILPGGGLASANLHVARAICRRAERRICPLLRANMIDESVFAFLNRLSDFFFMAARYAAMKDNQVDVIYKKPGKST